MPGRTARGCADSRRLAQLAQCIQHHGQMFNRGTLSAMHWACSAAAVLASLGQTKQATVSGARPSGRPFNMQVLSQLMPTRASSPGCWRRAGTPLGQCAAPWASMTNSESRALNPPHQDADGALVRLPDDAQHLGVDAALQVAGHLAVVVRAARLRVDGALEWITIDRQIRANPDTKLTR